MTKYSVKQLSKLAGVSVRTLHHYDRIGLLKPAFRSEKGYRYYAREELLLLQQVLLYRELGFTLKAIDEIIHDPAFDLIQALQSHRRELEKRIKDTRQLLQTIDNTIVALKNETEMLTYKDLYQGFSPEKADAMRKEVAERWGEEKLNEVEERLRKLGRDGWNDLQKKGEEISHMLAELMDLDPQSVPVQEAIALHFKHLNAFYEVTESRYRGLAKMYVEDERFTAHYDAYRKGLATFMLPAIEHFCDNGLKVSK